MKPLIPILAVLTTLALLSGLANLSIGSPISEELSEGLTPPCAVPATSADAVILARRGCCSWHGGVCGCSSGIVLCCDGALSPSCTCRGGLTDDRPMAAARPAGETPR